MPGALVAPRSQAMMARAHKAKQIRSSHSAAPRATILGVSIFLMAITWLVFGETLRHEPINFDDPGYVFRNPQITTGLTSTGILWAFTHSCMQNWHPLTWISHMLDCQFFGLNAGGHHFTNVLLHTIAVILLFLLFQKMTGALWRSAFVAALFAIHPLRVESVAWIAERKDVLSGVLFMLTLGAYVRYVREPSIIRYLIVAVLFGLGLMTKSMLVTLPFVLLVLDYWPLGRFAHVSPAEPKSKNGFARWWGHRSIPTRLILEKIPLIALSAASSIITLFAQKRAAISVESLPLVWRMNNAFVSYVAYIWQMVCPIRLALVYPHPEYRLSLWGVALAIAFLTGATVVVVAFRRKHPYLITGWLWYVGMLVPVIGILQVGVQARADRYTYLPQIGLYLIATWTIADLSVAWRYRRQILAVAATIVIAALAWLAWIQNTYWRDSETLWTRTLAVTSHNDFGHARLADLLLRRDRIDEAISHSEEALRMRPRNWNVSVDAHKTLDLGLFWRGRVDDVVVLRTLAAGYAESGRFSEAIETAQQALQLAIPQDNSALIWDLQLNITNYQRNRPLRDPGALNKTPPVESGNHN